MSNDFQLPKLTLSRGADLGREYIKNRVKETPRSTTMPDMVLSIEQTVNNALNGMLVQGYTPIYNRGQFQQFDNWENMSVQERMELVKTFTIDAKNGLNDLQYQQKQKEIQEAAAIKAQEIINQQNG